MITQQAQRRHIDAILTYADNGSPSEPPGSELIGRSWKRCIEEYGLDPSRPRSARIVTQQTLREHQDSVDEFLNVARAGVEKLYAMVVRLGYVLLLTDHRALRCSTWATSSRMRDCARPGYILGQTGVRNMQVPALWAPVSGKIRR